MRKLEHKTRLRLCFLNVYVFNEGKIIRRPRLGSSIIIVKDIYFNGNWVLEV